MGQVKSFFLSLLGDLFSSQNYLHPKETLGVASFAVLHFQNVDDIRNISKVTTRNSVSLRSGVSMFPIFCSCQIALNHMWLLWFWWFYLNIVLMHHFSFNYEFYLCIFFHNTLGSHKINFFLCSFWYQDFSLTSLGLQHSHWVTTKHVGSKSSLIKINKIVCL